MKKFIVCFIILAFGALSNVYASEQLTVQHFSQFEKKALALGEKFGPENVILCFDVDSTLLKFNKEIFDRYKSKQKMAHKQLITQAMKKEAKSNSFYKVKHVVRYLIPMEPVEKDIPLILQDLHNKGFNLLVITARAPRDYSVTVRELERNKMPFEKYGKFLGDGYTSVLIPGKNKFIQEPREICFARGVACACGQNKGAILLYLLKKQNLDKKYKAVTLIDDKAKNTNEFFSVFKDSPIDVTTFRYSYMDKAKQQFMRQDLDEVVCQYKNLKASLTQLFGSNWFKIVKTKQS